MKKINVLVSATICLAVVSTVALIGCDAPKKDAAKKDAPAASAPATENPPAPAKDAHQAPTPEAPKN